MVGKTSGFVLVGLLFLAAVGVLAQQNQEIPDAPSATRPVPPPAPPSPRPTPDTDNDPSLKFPEPNNPTATTNEPPRSAPDEPEQKTLPPPMPEIKTIPEGSLPPEPGDAPNDLYTIKITPTLVVIPVLVKDNDGRLVNGLQSKDFSVLENGKRQSLTFFTSASFPLSAAVIFDLGMPDVGVKKVQDTLPALQGAFSQFDEVAIYTYSSTVSRVSDFGTVGQKLTALLNQIKTYNGANNGPPVTSGPLGPQGPMINGHPLDTPIQPTITPPKEARVINDAILMAARDLSKRDRTRRKIIFVISDGRERRSTASYSDTLKVLLTQNIIVYAVGVESAAIPGYGTLQKLRVPKLGIGYGNILPKYVSATGGGTVYTEMARAGIESAYARAIGDARNQYTLGYAPGKGIGGYRQLEVRVRRPDVKVYARDGYYPLPVAK
jgi:VWFA-related protein